MAASLCDNDKVSDHSRPSSELTKRSVFTEYEKNLLSDLVISRKDILESKRTDAVYSKEKKEEWRRLVDEFNSMNRDGRRRNSSQLKNLYKNMKAAVRHNMAKENVSYG